MYNLCIGLDLKAENRTENSRARFFLGYHSILSDLSLTRETTLVTKHFCMNILAKLRQLKFPLKLIAIGNRSLIRLNLPN